MARLNDPIAAVCRISARTALLVLLALGLAACALSDTEPAPDIPQTSSLSSTDGGYKLEPGDNLKVVVFGQDQFSGNYRINPGGTVTFPQLGEVTVAGLTVRGMEAALTERLNQGGLDNPQVSVLLDIAKPVYVIGEVQRPGEYNFKQGLDLAGIVALAGGYTRRADTKMVYLTRSGQTGERAYRVAELPPLTPGDVIRVPDVR